MAYNGQIDNFFIHSPQKKKPNMSTFYRFYKGEDVCPSDLLPEEARLWNAERVFEQNFKSFDSSDWYAFFKDYEINGDNAGEIFIKTLNEAEHDKPSKSSKEWIFKLWLETYLFVDKFPSEKWVKTYLKSESEGYNSV
jgi:hypothetical protein